MGEGADGEDEAGGQSGERPGVWLAAIPAIVFFSLSCAYLRWVVAVNDSWKSLPAIVLGLPWTLLWKVSWYEPNFVPRLVACYALNSALLFLFLAGVVRFAKKTEARWR